jgi:hypothetical protein
MILFLASSILIPGEAPVVGGRNVPAQHKVQTSTLMQCNPCFLHPMALEALGEDILLNVLVLCDVFTVLSTSRVSCEHLSWTNADAPNSGEPIPPAHCIGEEAVALVIG